MSLEITEAQETGPAHLTFGVELVRRLALERQEEPVWLDRGGAITWGELGEQLTTAMDALRAVGVQPGQVVVVRADASVQTLVRIFAVAALNGIVAPLRRERLQEIERWKDHLQVDWVYGDDVYADGRGVPSARTRALFAQLEQAQHPGMILATGGTTGVPKVVLHDLSRLWSRCPVKPARAQRVLPLMHLDHIGGLDIAWRALASGQCLVGPPTLIRPDWVAEIVENHSVQVMPATPSFLQMLLHSGAAQRYDLSSLRVVPYGAEPMPPSVLQRLKLEFPDVTFTERFGTSETGVLPVTSTPTGLELRSQVNGYLWRVVGDELWIKSPTRALGYLTDHSSGMEESGWFRTGDIVEQALDGAIRILGRREEMINVGGEKVLPSEIENILLSHSMVADCRVFGTANGILGQVVAVDVVWQGPEQDAPTVKRRLRSFCARQLPPEKLPVVVRLVDAIQGTKNLKKLRSGGEQ